MQSTIIFLILCNLVLTVTVIAIGYRTRYLRAQAWRNEAEAELAKRLRRNAELEAELWASKYSTAERDRIHLEAELLRCRGLLMSKQGASEN